MKIDNYGRSRRTREVMMHLMSAAEGGEIPASLTRLVLLPIPTSRDGVHISGEDRLVSEVLCDVGGGVLIVGYGIPEDSRREAEARGADVLDVSLCDDFMRENAHISALGALGYILTELGAAPPDLSFGIVGYGRIGRALSAMIIQHGGRVKIFSGREGLVLDLCAYGVECEHTDYSSPISLSGIDVLINTAPTPLTHCFADGRIPHGMRVIELASGENFRGVEGVVRLPSIPDRVYPLTAARLYYAEIMKYIKEVYSQ